MFYTLSAFAVHSSLDFGYSNKNGVVSYYASSCFFLGVYDADHLIFLFIFYR